MENDGTIGCGINDYLKIKFNKLSMRKYKDLKIAVAGTGYVGLSMATLLAQHHEVVAVDVIPEKVEKINNRQCHYLRANPRRRQHLLR